MLYVTGAEKGLGKAIIDAAPKSEYTICVPREVIESGAEGITQWVRTNVNSRYSSGIWINNSGTNGLSWIGDTEPEDERIIQHNLLAPYWCINALKGHSSRAWKVINIASIAHRVPMRCSTLYCASKAGLVHMTKTMARELAPKGWVINAFAPGPIADTDMQRLTKKQVCDLRSMSEEEAATYALQAIPMWRETTCAEMAEAVWKLIGMPDYVNGVCLEAAGGQ